MSERIDRRAFLGTLPAAVVAGGAVARQGATGHARAERAAPASVPGSSARRLDAFGVQLYTLRSAMAEDVDRTLAAVAEIGYREVELAGLYGHTAREMRAKLDAVGLRAASSHLSLGEVRGDWARALEDAQELGQALVVVPSIPGSERDRDALRRVADDLSRAGELARSAGLRLGYHNHDWELHPSVGGARPIDILLERADPDFVDWQMDIFWTVHGGGDAMRELERRAGRVTSVHVKDRTADGAMVDVGAGVIDFATILRRAEGLGMLHAFVEHDRPGDAVESVRRSFEHLNGLGLGSRGG